MVVGQLDGSWRWMQIKPGAVHYFLVILHTLYRCTVNLDIFTHILISLSSKSEIEMKANICLTLNYNNKMFRWVNLNKCKKLKNQ